MPAEFLKKERITEYLQDLDHQLADLKLLPVPDAAYLADHKNFERIKAIKLSLACAVQDVVRISLHIATCLGLGSVRASETETISALGNADVITVELADRVKGMPSFRNRLIHDYLPNEFDAQRLYESLHNLNDFREFASQIVKWMEEKDE